MVTFVEKGNNMALKSSKFGIESCEVSVLLRLPLAFITYIGRDTTFKSTSTAE
jgi:hypothetical protein